MAQVAAGARSLPLHPSLVMLNSPDRVAVSIWSATVLGFLRVVVFAALVAPTTILPKLKVSGVIVSLPAIPVPLSVTAPALLLAESLIASWAPRAPSAVGVNVTFNMQLVPGASVAPQVLFEI